MAAIAVAVTIVALLTPLAVTRHRARTRPPRAFPDTYLRMRLDPRWLTTPTADADLRR